MGVVPVGRLSGNKTVSIIVNMEDMQLIDRLTKSLKEMGSPPQSKHFITTHEANRLGKLVQQEFGIFVSYNSRIQIAFAVFVIVVLHPSPFNNTLQWMSMAKFRS